MLLINSSQQLSSRIKAMIFNSLLAVCIGGSSFSHACSFNCKSNLLEKTPVNIQFKRYCSSVDHVSSSDGAISARLDSVDSVGLCSKDRSGEQYQSGRAPRAKFFDRAQVEVKDATLKAGVSYTVKALVKLSGEDGKGSSWAHQNGTTFFSIGEKTYATIWTNHGSITSSPKHAPEYLLGIKEIKDQWVEMEWTFKIRKGVFRVNYFVNGEPQRNLKYEQPTSHPIWDGKDKLVLRFGLLRPGIDSNSLQKVEFKKIKIIVNE